MAFPALRADYWYHTIKDEVEWIHPKGMPRKTAWLTAQGCTCVYGYGGHTIPSAPFPEWMPSIMHEVMPICEVDGRNWPNSCNLNLYNDKYDPVSWHSDNEDMFAGATDCIRIISLSLGAPRTFLVKGNRHYRGPTSQVQTILFHGDLLIMDGLVQKHFVHSVPKEHVHTWPHEGPRINLTWRWVKKHKCQLQHVHPVPAAQSSLL
jgi:alkylated DNA repair dioxygenase AlkB